jgi:Spy/CpxP family protein refolding chaperone
MLLKFLRARAGAAIAGAVAVVVLMAMSVGTVHAIVTQDQTQEEAETAAEALVKETKELQWSRGAGAKARFESRLERARELADRARAWGMNARAGGMQEMRGRIDRAPRMEIRGLRSVFGGSTAERALAMADELELTEQQQEQIRAARHASRRSEIERDAQIDMVDLDLDELLEDRHSADLDAVADLMQQRAALRVEGEIAGMRLSRQVWNLLTVDQQTKLDENRGGVFRLRGDGPNALFLRNGETTWDFDLGEVFDELHLDDLHFEGGTFEWESGDDAPNVWRHRVEPDDEDDDDGDDGDRKAGTTGAAVGT